MNKQMFNYQGRIVTASSREQAVRKIAARAASAKRKDVPANRQGRRSIASAVRRAKASALGTIKIGIDYILFMRLLDSAAFFSGDDNYKDALWDYFSDGGEISDGLQFFDNLFQYTAWWDEEELADEIGLSAKEGEDLEELCDKWLEEHDGELRSMYIRKYTGGYLVIM